MNTAAVPARAGRREWTGLAVIALPCALYSMDLTVLDLAVPSLQTATIDDVFNDFARHNLFGVRTHRAARLQCFNRIHSIHDCMFLPVIVGPRPGATQGS
jgi:hypothetical protein